MRALIKGLDDVGAVIANAEPKLKAEVYADLGLRLTYRPAESIVSVEAAPCAAGRVGGGTCSLTPRVRLRRRVSLAR